MKAFDCTRPAYMAPLVARAATLLQAQFPRTEPVAFDFLVNGQERRFSAKLHWPRDGLEGPRVMVSDGIDGMLCCQSLPGKLFTIDPQDWEIEAAYFSSFPPPHAPCSSAGPARATSIHSVDEALRGLQRQRAVLLASLDRALSAWQLSPTARAFAMERLNQVLGDEKLRALLTEAERAGVRPGRFLFERLACEVVCMWLLVGRGFDSPESLAAMVRGVTPMPSWH